MAVEHFLVGADMQCSYEQRISILFKRSRNEYTRISG